MAWLYFASLLISLGCLGLVDWRYKLALFYDYRRTLKTILPVIGIFIVWDILGILLGIFYHGGSQFSLPIRLAPEFPVEELLFLTLLSYVSLLLYNYWGRQCSRI